MTREEFIKILKKEGYPYVIEGDKIVITHRGNVSLSSLVTLPSGVEFRNDGIVPLGSLKTIPPGVEFRNKGDVYLRSLVGSWFGSWKGNIKGINNKRLLNLMISKGVFI